MEIRLKPSSVNRSIAAVNKFLKFMEMDDFTLKALRIQEQTTAQHELTQKEFDKLIESAFTNKKDENCDDYANACLHRNTHRGTAVYHR